MKALFVSFGAAILALGTLLAHNRLFVSYAQAGCATPAPPGCVVPVNNHGVVTYISVEHHQLLTGLWWSFGLFAVLAVAVFVVSRLRRPKPAQV
jgi:hypothetical protein